MKWAKSDKNRLVTHQTAYRIYQDILLSLESYYDDSFVSKFFLPDEINEHCKQVAASFALILYSPELTMEEVADSRIYYLYYLTMMYGAQIYLKEHGISTNHAHYRIEQDIQKIEELKNIVTELLSEEYVITPAATIVMDLYKEQIASTKKKAAMHIPGKKFLTEDFDRCLHGALIWGYFFAQEMVQDGD
jgi:hypothetical protein